MLLYVCYIFMFSLEWNEQNIKTRKLENNNKGNNEI